MKNHNLAYINNFHRIKDSELSLLFLSNGLEKDEYKR